MNKDSLMVMDPNILLSLINMKLRDNFSSLEALCDDMGIAEDEIVEKLKKIGCEYIREVNQFKQI